MGSVLESFDPIGRWRDHYPKVDKKAKQSPLIDTTAILSNGRKVNNLIEFKAMLLERESHVARCLIEKMLTYATGRLLETGDRGEVDRIANDLKEGGNRLRDLIHLVVQSELFLNK